MNGSILGALGDVILPVLAVAIIGGIVGRRLGLDLETLQRATFFLFSPALVFDGLATIELDTGVLARLLLVSVVLFIANAATGLGWARLRHADPPTTASIAVASALPNQGNMGLPMALLAFGSVGLEIATVLFVIGVILSASAAIALATFALDSGTPQDMLVAPLRYPSIYAAAAGLAVNFIGIDVPVAVAASIDTLAQAAIPVMLVILGLSFQLPRLGDIVDPLFVTVSRLLGAPILAWVLLTRVGLDDTARDVVILMAGMPVAVNTTILARQLGANVELSVRIVVVSTACSVLTLTGLLGLLG